MDKILFFCDRCYLPHLYYFIVPSRELMLRPPPSSLTTAASKDLLPKDRPALDEKHTYMLKRAADRALLQRWGNMEKETLKKYLL
jgi:hypothetical protein